MKSFKQFILEYGYAIGKHGKVTHTDSGEETREIHNDHTGNYLHMTFNREELSLGDVHFHGRMHGHDINFRSSNTHKMFDAVQPTKQNIHHALKKAHPNLSKEQHDKIHKIAWNGVKTHIPYEKAGKIDSFISDMSDDELDRKIKAMKAKKLH